MLGLDEQLAELGGGSLALALLAALLIGLRHATDPDHLAAVTTLTMSAERFGARSAALLGWAWGLGHACTLLAFGLPVVLLDSVIPGWLQTTLEFAVGLLIVVLAVRLLVRWRRGTFHAHVHRHGDVVHAHPHLHERRGAHDAAAHAHAHEEALGRTPRASFGIGLLHGAGGSAGVGILLVGAVPGEAASAAALAIFAAATAFSMALVTAAFGATVGRGRVKRRLEALAPVLGAASLLFGCWYALGAVGAVPYVL